jgi:hypothetical protein
VVNIVVLLPGCSDFYAFFINQITNKIFIFAGHYIKKRRLAHAVAANNRQFFAFLNTEL